ncbi:MAG TPA: hypothetical protein VJB70_04920 [Candidatus Paceibacterota bacterium]
MNPQVTQVVAKINQFIVNPIIGLLFAVALIMFLWGVVEFIFRADSDIARENGKRHMLWGIFGMFIMFAVFAIMRIIVDTFDITGVRIP